MPCQFCERDIKTTSHHLIPKTLHANKWFRKNFSLQDMQHRRIDLCKECHRFVHQQWDEKYLGKNLNTLDLLLKEQSITNFITFIKKQKVHNGQVG